MAYANTQCTNIIFKIEQIHFEVEEIKPRCDQFCAADTDTLQINDMNFESMMIYMTIIVQRRCSTSQGHGNEQLQILDCMVSNFANGKKYSIKEI